MKAPQRYCNKSVIHINIYKWSVCKSLWFLNNKIFILEMFKISPAKVQNYVLCKNRHDFLTEGFVQYFINIYYM